MSTSILGEITAATALHLTVAPVAAEPELPSFCRPAGGREGSERAKRPSHLGDLWDLGGVDGPAALGHWHSVPGLFSLIHALLPGV